MPTAKYFDQLLFGADLELSKFLIESQVSSIIVKQMALGSALTSLSTAICLLQPALRRLTHPKLQNMSLPLILRRESMELRSFLTK